MPPDDLDLLAADCAVVAQTRRGVDYAFRIGAALADLRETETRCRQVHYSDCLCGALAARTSATLTGKDTTDATT